MPEAVEGTCDCSPPDAAQLTLKAGNLLLEGT